MVVDGRQTGKRADTLEIVTPRESPIAADANNRSKLLQAASDAFAEFGFEGASLRAIADSAGVSFQLIAYYFGSKEELWTDTVDFLFDRYLETGKGMGFTPSGNLPEQFHNQLRLLLTDMLQRPQLHKIWMQEGLADSPRYHHVLRPMLKRLFDELALPYYREVVRLGVVERYAPEEICILVSAVFRNTLAHAYFVELALGSPVGAPKSVERQVDLLFAILTEKRPVTDEQANEPAQQKSRSAKRGAPREDAVVYPWKDSKQTPAADTAQLERLEAENNQLKQLVGTLSLEKRLLLDRLALLERPVVRE
jgi:AcrR family transcriptional regulator